MSTLMSVLRQFAARVPLAAGAMLLFGCLGVLLANVIKAAEHERVP